MPQPQTDITSYLKAVPTDDQTRAQTWEAYNNPANQQDFEQRLGKLNLPDQAKADLWESKYGSGKLNSPSFPTPTPPTTPQAAPASPPQKPVVAPDATSMVRSTLLQNAKDTVKHAWDWATTPIDVGSLRADIAKAHEMANAPPTMADIQSHEDYEKHPWYPFQMDKSKLHGLEQGADEFIAKAGETFLSPLGIATSVAGPLAKAPGAVGTLAKAGLTGVGLGFGASGAKNVIQHPGMEPGEDAYGYTTRQANNAAMLLGGAAGVVETPHLINEIRGKGTPPPPPPGGGGAPTTVAPPSTTTNTTPGSRAPSIDPATAAQMRIAQAVGSPKVPLDQTIYVDPDFATELNQWNNSNLPGKRVILKTNAKTGAQTVHLAHNDPDVTGFQYTNTKASNTFSTEGAEGQVPVELSKSNGTRGTSAPGHFLANTIAGDMPIAATQSAVPATVEPPPSPTPAAEVAPSSPKGWENHPNFPQPEQQIEGPRQQAERTGKAVTTPNGVTYGPGGATGYSSSNAPITPEVTPTPVPNPPGWEHRELSVGTIPSGPGLAVATKPSTPSVPDVQYTDKLDPRVINQLRRKSNPVTSTSQDTGWKEVYKPYTPDPSGSGNPTVGSVTLIHPTENRVVSWRIQNTEGSERAAFNSAAKYAEENPIPPTVAPQAAEIGKAVGSNAPLPIDKPLPSNQAKIDTQVSGGVRPGVGAPSPLPVELSKASPRYGYGTKNFNLQFDDPHDLAAYTLGQTKDNAAQAKFVKYLQGEYPDATLQDLKDHSLGVRASIKEMAKDANPEDGPLKIPSQGGIATDAEKGAPPVVPEHPEATVPKSQAQTPPVDVSPLEDKIRPLVGQVMRLGQLRVGEAASHAIDSAIEQTHSLTGGLDEDLQGKIGKLLGEPVGKNLNPDQLNKLETLRGAQGSTEPVLRRGFSIAAQEEARDPEAWQRRLDASTVAMAQALNDPKTPPELAKKLTAALMDTDKEGNQKPWLYEKDTVQYPHPEDLPLDHPEAPFASKKLGHEITPISNENYTAILGKQPKDLFFGRKNANGFVTPEENAQYDGLKDSNLKEQSGEFGLSDLIGKPDENGNATGRGSIFTAGRDSTTSGEFRDYERDLRQRVLARKLNATIQELKGKVGEWNKQRAGVSTPLTDQLSKLPADVRRYLPKELFNHEEPNTTQASNPSKTTVPEESKQTTGSTKTTAATAKSGQETSVEGIKTTKYDSAIAKKYPEMADQTPLLQKGIESKYPVDARQKVYTKVMKILHEGLVADDPFALKKAVDAFKSGPEDGVLGPPTYTPEELHSVNATTADALLSRWERMSSSELAKKKAGLWKNSLTNRVEGTAPTSNDPVVRLQQMDTYNDLKARQDALKKAVGPPTNLYDSMHEWVSNWLEDRPDKQMLREELGRNRRNNAIVQATFDSVDKLMNNLPIPEQDRFFDNMTRGTDQSDQLFKAMDPKFIQKWEKANGPLPDPNDLAQRIRNSFDAARDRVTQASGHLQEFIVNYMPGMYENQAKARAFAQSWASRRPMEGSSEFLKQKMYEFHDDALKAGLQPVTSNPVRAMLMRVEQLNRFTMAHEFKNRLVDGGFAEWYNTDDTPPEGHEALNDRIFGQGGLGNFWAPSKVARTFNNFVSTGLTGGWRVPYTNFSLYDAIKSSNNLANMMQLGFSAFHAVETTLNAGFTTTAVGIRQILNQAVGGRGMRSGMGGVGDRINAGYAGFYNLVHGATFIGPLIEDAWNGQKGLINFRDPSKELHYAQLGSDLEAANANVRTNPGFELQQIQRLKENWANASDNLLPKGTRAWASVKAASNLMASGVEAVSYPLMTGLIPRVKLGAFYKMAEQIHSEMAGQPPDSINLEMQKAWDSVDNRFGQVNYDNSFMNKIVKDIVTLAVRSPGWNMGTVREVGGGTLDAARSVKNVVTGNGLNITNRTAYTGAMVMGTMLVNSIYQYLHTGQPAQGIDYFFPKDGTKSASGEDNRVYPKAYVYDFINLYHDPVHTVWHKAAPDISTMADIIQNEDYYHHSIRNPGDKPLQQAASTMGYMAHQFVPFSIGNLSEAQLRGQSGKIEPFAGILPSPRWVGRTNAENLAYNYFSKTQATDADDPVSLERKKDFILLRNKVARGQISDDQIQDAMDKGKLNPKMVKYLYETQSNPQIVTWTKNLRSEDHVWSVWQAASPEEKKILLPTVISKISNLGSGDEQEKKLQELEDFANNN